MSAKRIAPLRPHSTARPASEPRCEPWFPFAFRALQKPLSPRWWTERWSVLQRWTGGLRNDGRRDHADRALCVHVGATRAAIPRYSMAPKEVWAQSSQTSFIHKSQEDTNAKSLTLTKTAAIAGWERIAVQARGYNTTKYRATYPLDYPSRFL